MVDDNLDQSDNLSKHSVGLLFEAEDVNRKDHPDAYIGNKYNPEVVSEDVWYTESRGRKSNVVQDRITWLIRKVTLDGVFLALKLTSLQGSKASESGRFETKALLQQFFISVDDPVLAHTVVLTQDASKKDHAPLRGQAKKIHSDYYVYEEKTRLSVDFIERAREHDWIIEREVEMDDGNIRKIQLVQMWWAFSLWHNDMSIEMIRRFVKPESIPHSSEITVMVQRKRLYILISNSGGSVVEEVTKKARLRCTRLRRNLRHQFRLRHRRHSFKQRRESTRSSSRRANASDSGSQPNNASLAAAIPRAFAPDASAGEPKVSPWVALRRSRCWAKWYVAVYISG